MKIIVCYKLVPDESGIKTNADGSTDLSACEWQIGQYDLCAVECGARLFESNEGSRFIAMTVGGDIVENSKLKKSILSRGPEELFAVKDASFANADSGLVARALAKSIEAMGDVDLVLFGEGSGDMYTQQVGCLTGALLGWNTVNAVSSIELKDGELLLERSLEDCTELLSVSLPAAVSVCSGICLPRLASMKEILKAGKKPSTVNDISALELPGATVASEIKVPKKDSRDCEILSGDDAVEQLAARLRKMI